MNSNILKTLISTLIIATCVQGASAATYTATEKYVQNAVSTLRKQIENANYLKADAIKGGEGITVTTNEDGTVTIGCDTPEPLPNMMPVLWAEMTNKVARGELVPGAKYRITNYVATTSGIMSSRSANHSFDIIVVADSTNTLNEVASAIQHTACPDDYFADCNLSAWELKYCLANDTSRFVWALADNATDPDTGTGGRGVVYRLRDEFGNDCPYDFKGLLFLSQGVSDSVYRYTFDSGSAIDNTDFSLDGLATSVYGNRIGEARDRPSNVQLLNNIVFRGEHCYANTFGFDCTYCSFGSYICDNIFEGLNIQIRFGDDCVANKIGLSSNDLKFNSHYYNITVQSGNDSIYLNATGDLDWTTLYRNVEILSGVNHTTIVDTNVNQRFHTTYKPNGSIDVDASTGEVIVPTGGGSVASTGMRIIAKENGIYLSTNNVILTDHAFNNVTRDDESVLCVRMPTEISSAEEPYLSYLVYKVEAANASSVYFDIDNTYTILVSDSSVFTVNAGTNILKFEEVSEKTILITKIANTEL